jgi:hypothetical protein
MDEVLFIIVFSASGIVAMLSFRAWELSRGEVVHSHPHVLAQAYSFVRTKVLGLKEYVLDVWFDRCAPHIARTWIRVARATEGRRLKDTAIHLYRSVRGVVSPHGVPDVQENREASEFLADVVAHKESLHRPPTTSHTRKKRMVGTNTNAEDMSGDHHRQQQDE